MVKVLIAEDDAASRLILERTIVRLGHECLVARGGHEAWDIFKNAAPDVVITDWMMPDIDGVELCRRIRTRPHAEGSSQYTYVIFLTALADRDHLLRAIEEGADDYLAKPLDRVELQVRLHVAQRVTSLYHEIAEQRTESERLNRILFQQARQDPLTQMGNRLRLQEDLDVLTGRVERYGHTYCVVLIDVDHFKRYNDRYGHQAGDDVLRAVARTVVARRRGDSCYRYGGEEFLLILPEQSVSSAAVAAEHVRRSVEGLSIPHEGNPPTHIVTVSAGVAGPASEHETSSVETLLQQADEALYAAKRSGRNCVRTYGNLAGV